MIGLGVDVEDLDAFRSGNILQVTLGAVVVSEDIVHLICQHCQSDYTCIARNGLFILHQSGIVLVHGVPVRVDDSVVVTSLVENVIGILDVTIQIVSAGDGDFVEIVRHRHIF